MKERTGYSQDPITEALLDIRIDSTIQPSQSGLDEMLVQFDGEYPQTAQMIDVVSQVSFGAQVRASAQQVPVGVARRSADNQRMLRAQADGMSFSELAPYSGWESFHAQAQIFWRAYRQYVQPAQIKQLSLRYINRFHLPQNAPLQSYLQIYPCFATEVLSEEGQVSGFFLQTQIARPDYRATVLINEATVPSETPGTGLVLLDINVFRVEDLPNDEVELWEIFGSLKQLKNTVFESLITEQTRKELMQ